MVCGGCLDFKIVVAVEAAHFGAWEVSFRSLTPLIYFLLVGSRFFPQASSFSPEAEIIAEIKAIEGATQVETQTYTFMDV